LLVVISDGGEVVGSELGTAGFAKYDGHGVRFLLAAHKLHSDGDISSRSS